MNYDGEKPSTNEATNARMADGEGQGLGGVVRADGVRVG